MDLSLLMFTQFSSPFCMKCIEFSTRTYNFKNLTVGSMDCSAKTVVNSPYFFSKIQYVYLLHIEAPGKPRRFGLFRASVNKNKYTFQSTSSHIFQNSMWIYEEIRRKDENRTLGKWILARNFLENYFDLYFNAWIVANCKTRRSSLCVGSVRKT